MVESNTPLTLAALRKSKPPRRRPPAPESFPTLFDLSGDGSCDGSPEGDTGDAPVPGEVSTAISALAPMHRELATTPAPALPSPATRPWTGVASPRSVLEDSLTAAPSALPSEMPQQLETARTWTVSDLVRHVRGRVEQGYGRVTLEGEISNWRPSGSGHCYFTIKDAGAQLSAVIFRRQASLLRFQPHDGGAVKLHGQLSVYENRGQLQLIVEWMQQAGLGALLAEVQRLKEALRREGLFERKRPLPPFPRCIGVITSTQGAALRDIVKVCRRRHASVRLLIYPAAVQGPNCPGEIAAGLRWFNAHPDQAEVLLLARGGGSWEDLHGFDHEQVARAIAGSVLPVITGIGHATDSTIADAAADVCAPTPSAAAELLTSAQHRVEEHVTRLHARLLQSVRFDLLQAQQRLARLGTANVLRRTEELFNRRSQQVDDLHFRAITAGTRSLQSRANRLRTMETRLALQGPAVRLSVDRRKLEGAAAKLRDLTASRVGTDRRRWESAHLQLQALSPLRVLDRGYALLYGPGGDLLRAADTVQTGDAITARLGRGSLQARILSTDPGANVSAAHSQTTGTVAEPNT